jgi:hypothetical protein
MSVLLSTGEVATMFANRKWIMPALAGLVALIGCGGEPSVASKSAAAFEETQQKGGTFEGEGHSHGDDHGHGSHGAAPSGSPQQPAASGEHQHHAGHGATEAPAAGHKGMDHSAHGSAAGEQPADHSSMDHGAGAHAGHAPRQSGSSRTEATGAGHEGHAGHGAPPAQAPADHSGHAGHSAPAGGTPSAPVAELPAQPASILQSDPLDAPAATSVVDAQRSAEMNQAMSGAEGHGGHGAGTYRHVDAGRGPGAHEGSEPQTPGAGPQHHDHGATHEAAAVYVCPMHPEVTSKTPGTCPKCGMALVERREE